MPVNIIHTAGDGRLKDQTPADIAALVKTLGDAKHVVLHFHGGLVNRASATAIATRLDPVYRAAQAEPAFFVWEAGLLEVVKNNLHEIGQEKIFGILLKKIVKHVVGKLDATPGQKAAGQIPYPRDPEVDIEIGAARIKEPYAHVDPAPGLSDTTVQEREALERELAQSGGEFDVEIRAIAASAADAPTESVDAAKGVTIRSSSSTRTLMSPDVIRELQADTDRGKKGLISTAVIVVRGAKVLAKVIARFVRHRDHGVYPTIVEEILREFYVANIGSEIWYQMKKETADTFVDDGNPKGGRLIVDGLCDLFAAGKSPRITLIGHSTGAVFILNFLKYVDVCRSQQRWPADRKIDQIIFLAPACTHELMADALDHRRDLFDKFRMLAMSDGTECADSMLPAIYTRSLLYFVSGVVERDGKESASDLPIVGMQRFLTRTGTYDQPEVQRVRAFFQEDPARAVWSICDDGDGRRSNSVSHGGFDDNDPLDPAKHQTMASVRYMIERGI